MCFHYNAFTQPCRAKTGAKKTIGNIELTPMEERKRQLRAMRFQNDVSATPAVVPPAKKKNKAFTPIVWANEAEADMNDVIVGTSTELEKPYFRLTSVRRSQASVCMWESC